MNYLTSLLKELVAKRKLIWELSKADFRKRFVGSYFGVVWMFIQPIVTVLIYWLIFGPIGFKSAPPVPNASYVQWLIPGIAPWFFFSEALNCGTGCLQEYNYLVKKVVFKVEILPVIKLISCLFVHVFFILIMFFVFLISGKKPELSWIQIIYYSFATSMYALALTYLTSAIQVFFKDMAQIVSICLQFGMWLTPIMYSEQLFLDKGLTMAPMILKLNPSKKTILILGGSLGARTINRTGRSRTPNQNFNTTTGLCTPLFYSKSCRTSHQHFREVR